MLAAFSMKWMVSSPSYLTFIGQELHYSIDFLYVGLTESTLLLALSNLTIIEPAIFLLLQALPKSLMYILLRNASCFFI